MSRRGWHIISWLWLASSLGWMAAGAHYSTVWGLLITAIVARGIGDVLEAIEKRNP